MRFMQNVFNGMKPPEFLWMIQISSYSHFCAPEISINSYHCFTKLDKSITCHQIAIGYKYVTHTPHLFQSSVTLSKTHRDDKNGRLCLLTYFVFFFFFPHSFFFLPLSLLNWIYINTYLFWSRNWDRKGLSDWQEKQPTSLFYFYSVRWYDNYTATVCISPRGCTENERNSQKKCSLLATKCTLVDNPIRLFQWMTLVKHYICFCFFCFLLLK